MVQGPQRRGYPNVVSTPHGQQLGRRSDTEYTHAVVQTRPSEEIRSKLQGHIESLQRMMLHDEHPAYKSRLKRATKDLAGLPESGPHASLVSMHQSPREAEKRRTREAGRGTGFSVLPVRQDED